MTAGEIPARARRTMTSRRFQPASARRPTVVCVRVVRGGLYKACMVRLVLCEWAVRYSSIHLNRVGAAGRTCGMWCNSQRGKLAHTPHLCGVESRSRPWSVTVYPRAVIVTHQVQKDVCAPLSHCPPSLVGPTWSLRRRSTSLRSVVASTHGIVFFSFRA